MRPIPQSIEAARELDRNLGHQDGVLTSLQQISDHVRDVVPQCVGLSITWNDHGITFTLVASDDDVAVMDGVQYLDGGPCVQAAKSGQGIETTHDELVSEDPWQMFAQVTAARGVRSSLTMPLTDHGKVVGSVNLYGATDLCFEEHHEELGEILGAWAPGAVRNADLSFTTLRLAEQAPRRLRDEGAIGRATGVLAIRFGIDVSMAEQRLEEAARRARVTPAQLAEALLELQA